jgi:hypothetical protein
VGVTTRAAWWLIAARACHDAVIRLGGLTVPEARAAATAGDLVWARSGDGGGFSCGGHGAGYGDGDGIGCGDIYGGRGGGYGDIYGGRSGGYGGGGGGGGGVGGYADVISITIDGETMTPAEARERVRQWAT